MKQIMDISDKLIIMLQDRQITPLRNNDQFNIAVVDLSTKLICFVDCDRVNFLGMMTIV